MIRVGPSERAPYYPEPDPVPDPRLLTANAALPPNPFEVILSPVEGVPAVSGGGLSGGAGTQSDEGRRERARELLGGKTGGAPVSFDTPAAALEYIKVVAQRVARESGVELNLNPANTAQLFELFNAITNSSGVDRVLLGAACTQATTLFSN